MANKYFAQGTTTERSLVEDLIIESISFYGQTFYYIPRVLVSKDDILGEDRLSKFQNAYPIKMYLETVDGFEGQGAFIQKFGLMNEQSVTLTLARKTWDKTVGKYGTTILPNRPGEGDLIYFPLTKGLFEIKFVQSRDPFYQLGKLYVYKLEVELFQYASEKIDTGVPDIDVFEDLKSFDTTINEVVTPDNYGTNREFKVESDGIVFDSDNPFGELVPAIYATADATIVTSDSSILTADRA